MLSHRDRAVVINEMELKKARKFYYSHRRASRVRIAVYVEKERLEQIRRRR